MPALLLGALFLSPARAQTRHEVGLTLGRLLAQTRRGPDASLQSGSGAALQANYGFRLFANSAVATYLETHFLASPQRKVASSVPSVISDVASLYVTPGLRFKFAPAARVSPWFAIGGGLSVYEHSMLFLGGTGATVPRTVTHGAFQFGGGVDFPVWRWLGGRVDLRDFYTPSPAYNLALNSSRQHNPVVSGGLLLKWGE